jgi:hypothetical protein
MVDGGPFVIVTKETWSQNKTRMFVVHGQTIDELKNVYSYFKRMNCLLVGSDSGQLDIVYSESPGAELLETSRTSTGLRGCVTSICGE